MWTAWSVAGAFLAAVVCLGLWLRARVADKALERRLRRVAGVLAGELGEDSAEGRANEVKVSVFRALPDRSRWRKSLEDRFCMLEGRDPLPKAAAVGLSAGILAIVVAYAMQFGLLTFLIAPAVGVGGGWVFLSLWDARVRAEFVKQFPEIADQIVRLARAGLPALEAIAEVARTVPEPARHILQQISDELSSGLDPETVLRDAATHIRVSEFTLFTAALALQRTTGGSIAVTIGHLAATVRARMEVQAKAYASTSQTRTTLWVLAAVPVVSLLGQAFSNPGAVSILFETEEGGTLLRWGVGLIVVGLLAARGIAARFLR